MVENVEKYKNKLVKKLKWKDFIFHCHNPAMSEDFEQAKKDHPNISENRVAYSVCLRYYSTTTLKDIRKLYYYDKVPIGDCLKRLYEIVHTDWLNI